WSRWINQSRDTSGMGSSSGTWLAKLRLKSHDDSLKMPLYAHGLYGQNQIIGHDDTGIDYDNVYFRDPGGLKPVYDRDTTTSTGHDTLVYGTNAHRKIVAYNVWADTQDLNSSGHGTHTEGSITGDSMGSTHSGALTDTVLARAMGMAPLARTAFTDIGGAGDALYTPANLNSIYRWEYNAGARVTSSSWGYNPGQPSSYGSFEEQLDTLAWSHKDLIMLRSAGNSNTNNDSVNWPACGKNIICVGANESGFGDGTAWSSTGGTSRNEIMDVAEFSSHGPTKEGLRRPHILASGGWYIWSVDSDGSLTSNNSGITYMGGTSMATPIMAGLTALLRQYLTEGWYPTGTKVAGNAIADPSGALMKALMILSSRNSPGAYSTDALNSTGTKNVPSQGQGWGSVDMNKALYFSGDARKMRLIDVAPGFTSSGQSATYTITTGTTTNDPQADNDSMDLKIVLVYFDYPSALSPMDISVNNLNLSVTVGGSTYLGNVFGANGYSTTGGTADTLNPEEVVWLPPSKAKSSQTATITVTAATINQGPVPYALVAGGDIVTSTGFLGVSFSAMTAQQSGESVVLTWRTESEHDCYRWEVQRSRSLDHGYAALGTVDGHGTVSTPTDYRYVDRNGLEAGTYYYKLTEVDGNGATTDYGPIACVYSANGKTLPDAYQLAPCYPNPSKGGVTFRYALKNAGPTSLR
ncbi:MAG TPA: S8 family serine peptidase, partial [Candidatus Edwardsbacteria bacterium]|nr:S8 family serine peptidase [Candidatus Edwardsbacteria bacterium]